MIGSRHLRECFGRSEARNEMLAAGERFSNYHPMFRRFLLLGLTTLLGSQVLHAEPEYPAMGPDIFDRQLAGEVLIERAVIQARKEDKRILVLFGANWCPWCRRLHRLVGEAPALVARLQRDYVLVYVDANFRRDKNRNAAVLKRYVDPVKQYGLPVLVVLDRNGIQLTTQETNSLAAPTDEETVRQFDAFLAKWTLAGSRRTP